MVENDLQQGQLAKELDVSPSILSNYITGKNIPEMDFLAKCIKRFNLQNEEIKEIFTQYFLSSRKEHKKIILNLNFFKPERIDLLADFLTVLLLYPYDDYTINPELSLTNLKNYLSQFHNDTCYIPPVD